MRLLFLLAGMMTWFAFTGDIIADSISDAFGQHCVAPSAQSGGQQEKAPCSHCACAVHHGAVVASNFVVRVRAELRPSVFFLTSDPSAPPPLPGPIDHPPQLV